MGNSSPGYNIIIIEVVIFFSLFFYKIHQLKIFFIFWSKLNISCFRSKRYMSFGFVTPVDLNELSFMVMEIPQIGIQVSMPDDWTQVQPDYFISPDQSIEILFLRSQESSPENLLRRWGASEPIEQIQVNELSWNLYQVNIQDLGAAGFVAVSTDESGMYILLVLSIPSKQDDIYETLVIPIVRSIKLKPQ